MFTSRLPKSTSARRSSNPNEGYTSLIGSHIPVSVKKANFFTPKPQRSLGSGMTSTAGKSYMATDKKYQRLSKPAPDRDEQIRMFESLVDFLRMNGAGFPIPEAKRFLSSISITEATRIFEFLINQPGILPDYKINKLETDAPEVLQLLNYPYIKSVTKSSLVSITTRQAIGNILTIFNWLVNLCSEAPPQQLFDQDRELTLDEKVFQAIIINPQDPREELSKMLQRPTESTDELNNELERFMAEYNRLAAEVEELQALEQEKREVLENIEKCTKYYEDMKKYIAIKTEDLEQVKQDNLKWDLEIERYEKECEVYRQEVGEFESITKEEDINARKEHEIEHDEGQNEIENQRYVTERAQIQEQDEKYDKECKRSMELLHKRETRLEEKLKYIKKQSELDDKLFEDVEPMQIKLLKETFDRFIQEEKKMLETEEKQNQRISELISAIKQEKKALKRAAAKLLNRKPRSSLSQTD